jgi:predicted metal-dependent peptidase
MEIARIAMVLEAPFFGALALKLKLTEAPWLPYAMAVDGVHLYYHKDRILAINMGQLKGMICHETLHVALGHPWRAKGRDPDRWNVAADYVINPMVISAGMELADGMLFAPEFDGLPSETVYARLGKKDGDPNASAPPEEEQGEEGEEQGDGQGEGEGEEEGEGEQEGEQEGEGEGDGEGEGEGDGDADLESQGEGSGEGEGGGEGDGQGDGDGDGGEGEGEGQGDSQGDGHAPSPTATTPDGRPLPSPEAAGSGAVLEPPPDENGNPQSDSDATEQEAEWKMAVAQAAQLARAAGKLPGFMEEILKDDLAPKAPWQQLLRQYMNSYAKDDYTWQKPNRRHVANGLYLPSIRSETVGTIALFFDTSGSIDSVMLAQFVAEVNSILEDIKPERLLLIQVDTQVNEVQDLSYDDLPFEFTAKGRGGTYFQPAFDWIEEQEIEPVCAVYLTDMAPGDVPRDPGYPVLWVDFAAYDWLPDMPFGERIYIQ